MHSGWWKNQMHSGWWGLRRETKALLDLRQLLIGNSYLAGIINNSCEIFFCFIPLPIPQCIVKNSNAISSIVDTCLVYFA